MTDYAWPTAPVIRARWRAYGSNSYDGPALYFRATTGGDYLNPGIGKWSCPEDGEFTTITEYVEATELEKRLDQIRQLENALRKKNAKLRFQKDVTKNLAYQRKLASDMLSPRALIHHEDKNPDPTPIAHTTIRCIKDNQLLRWMVVVTPPGGPQLPVLFSTYQQAIDWVANELYSQ